MISIQYLINNYTNHHISFSVCLSVSIFLSLLTRVSFPIFHLSHPPWNIVPVPVCLSQQRYRHLFALTSKSHYICVRLALLPISLVLIASVYLYTLVSIASSEGCMRGSPLKSNHICVGVSSEADRMEEEDPEEGGTGWKWNWTGEERRLFCFRFAAGNRRIHRFFGGLISLFSRSVASQYLHN